MNPELYMVILPATSALLYALGGTQISNTIGGQKWIRRFLLPVIFIATCLIASVIWWKACLVGIIAMISYVMPYGERSKWLDRLLVAVLLSLISLPIGLSWWNAMTGIAFLLLFLLSNTKLTANTFVWKICESSVGFLCGIQVSYILTHLGRSRIWI